MLLPRTRLVGLSTLLLLVACTKPNGAFDDPRLESVSGEGTASDPAPPAASCEPELCLSFNAEQVVQSDARLSGVASALTLRMPEGYTRIAGAEVTTGLEAQTHTLALHRNDAGSNPGSELASQSWTSSAQVGWQGVNFTSPVPLDAGQQAWLVWRYPNAQAQQASTSAQGESVNISVQDSGETWTQSAQNFMARIYCCKP